MDRIKVYIIFYKPLRIIQILRVFNSGELKPLGGIEPPTYGFFDYLLIIYKTIALPLSHRGIALLNLLVLKRFCFRSISNLQLFLFSSVDYFLSP